MNFWPMLDQLSIVDKDGNTRKLTEPLFPSQAQFIDEVHRQWNINRPVRIIVLKGRQVGISTATEALLFCMSQIFDNARCRVVAHDNDATQGLLEMSTNYWETYPAAKLKTLKYNSRNELAWIENKSSIRVSTAKNTRAGRSKTIRALHASEVGFWDNPDPLMLGLSQSIPNRPGTFVCLESTANGLGNWFHRTWVAAEEREISYVPMFFPWYEHPEYTAEHENLDYPSIMKYTDEEKVLRRMGISDSRIIWRRTAIKDRCNRDVLQFHQEYPTVPEEAFISTGANIFPYEHLQIVYQPMLPRVGRLIETPRGIEFLDDVSGPLSIYWMPSDDTDWGRYMIGGDSTKSTRGDYSCLQVINRRSMQQCAVFRARVTPMHLGQQMAWLGQFYNQAMLAPEIQGGGYATVGVLTEKNYPYIWRNRWAEKIPGALKEVYGWETTVKTKHWAVGALLQAVVDHSIVIHDKTTFKEMGTYVAMPDGNFGNEEGEGKGHDDTVVALAIATVCHLSEPPLPFYTGQMEQREDFQLWQEFLEGELGQVA